MKVTATVMAFQFKHSKTDKRVDILNDKSYVMGHYNQRTGTTSWERVVLTTQRENIEAYLKATYPVIAAV